MDGLQLPKIDWLSHPLRNADTDGEQENQKIGALQVTRVSFSHVVDWRSCRGRILFDMLQSFCFAYFAVFV
jgi:hypothetical protein